MKKRKPNLRHSNLPGNKKIPVQRPSWVTENTDPINHTVNRKKPKKQTNFPSEIEEALLKYAGPSDPNNLDPMQRPYITLTNKQMKPVNVYMHWLGRCDLSRTLASWTVIELDDKPVLTVKETPLQIHYLCMIRLGLTIWNEEMFKWLRQLKPTYKTTPVKLIEEKSRELGFSMYGPLLDSDEEEARKGRHFWVGIGWRDEEPPLSFEEVMSRRDRPKEYGESKYTNKMLEGL